MSYLIELPMELLTQILEEVGGSYLRRGNGAARLCICRKWYAAARPVYLSGLETTNVNFFGHNISTLDDAGKLSPNRERNLMYKNTRRLRLRLLGHYWDEASSRVYDEDYVEPSTSDMTREQQLAQVLARTNEPPFDFKDPENVTALESWRDNMLSPRLDSHFADLGNFEVLETLIFEASGDPEVGYERGPHWDYLYQVSVLRLLKNLPLNQNLKNLTLDISGMRNGLLVEESDTCQSIANVLPRIENVRLRMHALCRSVFSIEAGLHSDQIKLKNFVIKLYLPSFYHTQDARVQSCLGTSSQCTSYALVQSLVKASQTFLEKLAILRQAGNHGMEGFRISYVAPGSPIVSTVDLLTMKMQMLPEQYYLYADDGKPNWYELERAKEMLYGGVFS